MDSKGIVYSVIHGGKPQIEELKGASPPLPAAMNGVPMPPEWLDADAKAAWFEIAPGMHQQGKLTPAIQRLLAHFCIKCGVVKQAYEILKVEGWMVSASTGSHGPKRHPAATVLDAAAAEARHLAVALGFVQEAQSKNGDEPGDLQREKWKGLLT